MEHSVVKNEEVLMVDYLPKFLPHREQQIKILAENLEPISSGRNGTNTFFFGPPGVGKTCVVRFVLREFENYANVNSVYLNCWDYNTSLAILSAITIRLGYPVARRGWAKDEIMNKLIEALTKSSNGLIVALDEVDQLIYKDPNVLYDLLRVSQYVENPIAIVLVSNYEHVFSKVEPRVKSSLAIEGVEFRPYTFLEMKDILQARAKQAFFRVEPGVVALAANHAVKKGGDVRAGLECLLRAGRKAERENAKQLGVKHLKAVLKEVREVKPEILYERLNEHERLILEAIKQPMKTSDLYESYLRIDRRPLSERRFRSYLNHLIEIGLVRVVGRESGVRVVKRAE